MLTDGPKPSPPPQHVLAPSSHSSQQSLDAVFPIVDVQADCLDITADYKFTRGRLHRLTEPILGELQITMESWQRGGGKTTAHPKFLAVRKIFFLSENFGLEKQKLGLKPHFGERLGTKLDFRAPIISSVEDFLIISDSSKFIG